MGNHPMKGYTAQGGKLQGKKGIGCEEAMSGKSQLGRDEVGVAQMPI